MIIYLAIGISGLLMILWGILELRRSDSLGVILLAEKRPNLKRKQKRPLQGL